MKKKIIAAVVGLVAMAGVFGSAAYALADGDITQCKTLGCVKCVYLPGCQGPGSQIPTEDPKNDG